LSYEFISGVYLSDIIPTALHIRTQYHASSNFFLHSTIAWQGSGSAACV